MMDTVFQTLHFDRFGWRSLFDILALTIIIYQILRLFQGTRAIRMLYGLLVLVVVYILTEPGRVLGLPTLNRVLGALLLFTPLAIVVLFQNHIRRMLALVGSNPLAQLTRVPGGEKMVDEIVLAAATLASNRHGALMVLEREQGLRTFAETGIHLDAIVSYDLLTTIFMPHSPLHDGAVIIAEGRIRAASCFLPLTTDPRGARDYGSRHRAAIGITEETDAVAIVVSEETGLVSFIREGRVRRGLEPQDLNAALLSILAPHSRRRSDRGALGQPVAATDDSRSLERADETDTAPEATGAAPATPAGQAATAPSEDARGGAASGPETPRAEARPSDTRGADETDAQAPAAKSEPGRRGTTQGLR